MKHNMTKSCHFRELCKNRCLNKGEKARILEQNTKTTYDKNSMRNQSAKWDLNLISGSSAMISLAALSAFQPHEILWMVVLMLRLLACQPKSVNVLAATNLHEQADGMGLSLVQGVSLPHF